MKHIAPLIKNVSPADIAAAGSIGTAGWTWLANANDILQLIATIVAIISGIYAIRHYHKKIKEPDKD